MLCVKAELISTRLLSEDDKQDMLSGQISDQELYTATKVWKEQGMRNYSDGSGERYRHKYW